MSLMGKLRTAGKAAVAVAAAVSLAVTVLIKPWEGVRYTPYRDVGGVWTVCHGHTGNDIILNKRYTPKECEELLTKDVEEHAAAVQRLVKVPVSDETMAALISFAYNVGIDAFAKSTLLKKLNGNNVVGACDEMKKWTYVKGKHVEGLKNRRMDERALCLKNIHHNI